jgi:phosphatidylserine/phosphatidylglycerophosphate/cardiolipin synthase-like enzyme
VEGFIRLMRAGWVELSLTGGTPVFKTTPIGAAMAPAEELPAPTTIERRWRGFAIDQVTGCVFRSRDLDIPPLKQLPTGNDEQVVTWMPSVPTNWEDFGAVFAALEGEDEVIIGFDSSPECPLKRHAVVTVRDNSIEGLPSGAPAKLRSLILKAAKDALLESNAIPSAIEMVGERTSVPIVPAAVREAIFDQEDLIIDGSEHKRALQQLLQKAADRVIIHSTFITEAAAKAALPWLLQAAARGVRIDVLWGQNEERQTTASTRAEAEKLGAWITEAGRSNAITVHPFSTNSHAKIVIADNGKGGWSALLGSCNWLASSFDAFEVSVRLRDPSFVGELLTKMARLSVGQAGLWHNFATELTVLGRHVATLPRPSGRVVPMKILYGPDHADLVLEARDHAKRRLFVTSHRIGLAAKPMVLLPALSAAKQNGVSAHLYYGRTTGPLSGLAAAELGRELHKKGIDVSPVHQPRLHAKVLGWDDDSLSITSLNWLSADPPDYAPLYEIGVLIQAPKVTDFLIRRFQLLRTP